MWYDAVSARKEATVSQELSLSEIWNMYRSDVKFLIIRQGEPPTEPLPRSTTRAGWTGRPEEWFKDTDEVAPGVRVKFLGYGDQLDKDRNPVHGALIAVWDYRPEQ